MAFSKDVSHVSVFLYIFCSTGFVAIGKYHGNCIYCTNYNYRIIWASPKRESWHMAMECAVLVGFLGVLVILQPSAEFSSEGTTYALIGVITYALTALTARKLANIESVSNLSFYIFIGPTIMGAMGSYYSWIPPIPWDLFLFFLTGLTGGLAFIFFNLALQKAEASLLTSFEYTGLIWASLAGYFIFNEVVDSKIWMGAAIIIFCGIIILYRESTSPKTNENSIN